MISDLCQRRQDGFGMSIEWSLSIVFPIFKGMADISNYSCYRAVKLLEHGMKLVERGF